jgi:catecholate siderophore receptor
LTAQTQALQPEKLKNIEAGAKWDITPAVSATAAVYQLNRTNTRAPDPSDPTRFVLTGASRTRGIELGIAGQVLEHWQVLGGYAYQDAVITRSTSAAAAGAKVALVPAHTFSLWNKVDLTSRWSAGIGLIAQAHQYAAVDNSVKLPGFLRADAAVYYRLAAGMALQVNVENLFDRRYILTADGNNNISPGSTRAVRARLTTTF